MANETTIKYDRASFVHWEADRTQSRGNITLSAKAEVGDLLVLGDSGYEVYSGTAPTVKSSPSEGDIVVAIALEAGKSGDKIPCIVRNATVVQDRINNVTAEAFGEDGDLISLAQYFERQKIVPRLSIAVQRSVIS